MLLRRISVSACACLVAGCIFSGRVESGVNPSLQLNEVSDSQKVALCQAGVRYKYIVTSGNLRCKTVAVTNMTGEDEASLRLSCNSLVDQCLDEGVPGQDQDTELRECSETNGTSAVYQCPQATVGELEECEADRYDQLSVAVNELPSCDEMTAADLDTLRGSVAYSAIPSCQKLEADCR